MNLPCANWHCHGQEVRYEQLRQAVDEYLALCQAMGFKLHEESRLLLRFIDFLEAHGEVFITTDLAVRWATQCRAAQPTK